MDRTDSCGHGTIFLHNSTITNSPQLRADGAIWTAFASLVAPNNIGVQPRLFKSGVLCAIGTWTYNATPSANLSSGVTADCGTGSYNSHAFVRARNGTAFNDYVTFPTNPLDWTSPSAARSAIADGTPAQSEVRSGVTADGRTFGSAAEVTDLTQLPDLIAAVADDGTTGYVTRDDIEADSGATEVPVYSENGSTVVGTFTVG